MRSILVVLHTKTYAPNQDQQVSLLCQDSLTGSPLNGAYCDGAAAWYFVLKICSDKPSVKISFWLNKNTLMKEEPYDIDPRQDIYHFYEGPVTFSADADWEVYRSESVSPEEL